MKANRKRDFIVIFENDTDILADFKVSATSLKAAKRIAQFHKRRFGKKCRTRVYEDVPY